jgi:hypothetical protein
MDDEGVGSIALARPQRSRDGGGDRTSHAARCHVLHEHLEREDQRDARERGGAEPAGEKRIGRDDHGQRHKVQDVRRGELEERRHDRAFEQSSSARRLRCRRRERRPASVSSSS